MLLKAEELLEKCEQKIKWINWKFLLDSYRSEFEEIRLTFFKNININGDELKIFIDICENRLDRAKSFLGHTTTGLSILIGSFVVLASILISTGISAGFFEHPLLDVLKRLGYASWISASLVLIIAIFLALLVAHYRTEVHAWYVFKEGALLMKKEEAKAREEGKGKNK